ncbi:glycerol acyltransferase [Maribacter algarum]|uniref:Glycerol acyltransferase n=1 Tax=Maribacter algarum (ex Zhang et al. 2020) TaxID=2578118 RepID=A0A5S3PU69_9FLAO|nr:MMPL family transporter [Maribacter algarum]TMM58535.1 glycerol acyltransferase [Maribacter algarum]
MGDFFYKAYLFIQKRKWVSLFVLLLVIASLGGIASRIEFDEDITALIPATEESKKIQEVLESIAFTDKVIVNIRREGEGSVDDLTQYASTLLDSLAKTGDTYINNVQGKLNDEDLPNTLNLVYDNLPLFLDSADYLQIEQKLSKDSIAILTEQNYRTLISPSGIIAKRTIRKDPLGLSFIALKKLQQLGIGNDFKLKNGFLLDKKELNILLFLTPTHGSRETDKNTALAEKLYELQHKLNTSYKGKIKSEYFGAALVAAANAAQIKHDIQFTISIALTFLLIILIVFYRKLTTPLILFSPTVIGGLLAVAFLYLFRTKISALSLGIGSILLGITLDYSLHILTHIRNGNSLKSLYKDVAPSVLMSSLTTASAFLCLLFLESQALQDLGIFAAVSVLGASIFALMFIPQVYATKRNSESKKTFLDRLARYDLHKNKWAIAVLALLLIGSLFTYRTVIFNQDIAKLNYESGTLIEARERLEKLTDIGSKSIYLSTYGENRESVLQRNDFLFNQLQRLKANDEIVSYSSIGALVRSDKKQRSRINKWNSFWNANKIQSTKQNLIESGNEFGFKENTFDQFYDLLESDFKPLKISDLEVVSSFAVDDFIVTDSTSTTITSLIKVEDENLEKVKAVFGDTPQTLFINRQQVNESFLGNLKNDFNNLIGYSLLVVILILLLFYRSLSLTLITVIPIFLTWLLTIGLMGLLKIEFNIFNIIICSFIFGVGIDYCIFITNGLLTEYRTGEKALSTHRTSIILSVITTILGIGALVFAKHPVLYTIAVVSLIGILSAVFVAFAIQPLLFHLFLGSTNKRPITIRVLIHSLLSFAYFDLGGLLLSVYGWIVLKLNPKAHLKKQLGLHKLTSKFMKSVLYTNPFLLKEIRNPHNETFENPAMLIANHSSFLDILAMGSLHSKLIYLVKDHVYNSPIIGSAAKLHGAYPVSGGIENGEAFLKQKVEQGFSIIAFPEGARSTSNKINRFHKGAFYLAEKLELDILPVMIHGGSEVSPKNSFIIRDGDFTVKLLPRIEVSDLSFGKSYSERPKQIGQYFRKEFRKFRMEVEDEYYWHQLLLENFRHKGGDIYKTVKTDLKENASAYRTILEAIGEKDKIIHLSKDHGQLDLLLALDSIDRKIYSYLENDEARTILKNNYLTHQYSKIKVGDYFKEALEHEANVLILNLDSIFTSQLEDPLRERISILILLKSNRPDIREFAIGKGFSIEIQEDNLTILKR